MSSEMDMTPLDVSVPVENAPVLASEEKVKESDNAAIASADPEEAPALASEDQHDDAPVLASKEQYDDSDNESTASADSYGPVLADEDHWDDAEDAEDADNEEADNESIASAESEETQIEPFEDYELKIEQLLLRIGFPNFEVEKLQHDLHFSNCVYALTSPTNPEDKYILRIPNNADLREDDGVCEAIIDDAALLGYLADRLPVPRVVAYSATKDNALGDPYTLQTCLPGMCLDNIWEELEQEGKLVVIDEYVRLIAKLEAITFSKAGNFTASALEPTSTNDFSPAYAPEVTYFGKGEEEYVGHPTAEVDRAGSDLEALLVSYLDGRIDFERKHDEKYNDVSLRTPYWEKMKKILDILDTEGKFD
ncbi:MAG: hypothetical protein Q9226_001105 [Calogaya cf. arnoldii]